MDYAVNDLESVSKHKEYYFRKTPVFIFIFIYCFIILAIGAFIFANHYELNNKIELSGSISINQDLIIGQDTREDMENDFDLIYTAKVLIPIKTLKKVDTSKKIECVFEDSDGDKKKLKGFIDSFEGESGDSVIANISIYNYELSGEKIYYVKQNTESKFTVMLIKEKLIDNIKKKVF
jgi:hypothetical protein